MKIVVLDAATLGTDLDLSPLSELGEVTVYADTVAEQAQERLRDADVAVVNKLKMNEKTLDGTAVKLVCVAATGYDNIDTSYCAAHGIGACNVPGYSTDNVAQLTLAMALSLVTHLTEYRTFVHTGQYAKSGVANYLSPQYHEISALTWGVVGGGGIGSRVAQLAQAMGCRVLMCRRKPDDRFETADIDTLCEQADILSLHVPLTAETRGMINADRLARMKDGAILINVARGAVTDEEAVAQAVESGKLGGLGVDVYTAEPFDDTHPFARIVDRDNVCLTPHMAWGSVEARQRCLREIVENIRAYTAGSRRNRVE
ncbi:MAG: hydroxyacid dehydrogenase [Clostridia bacterium]|nr:hydroxyacid dehydrogenase [Clostridia bacterium]